MPGLRSAAIPEEVRLQLWGVVYRSCAGEGVGVAHSQNARERSSNQVRA
jgi:hypothetical protein